MKTKKQSQNLTKIATGTGTHSIGIDLGTVEDFDNLFATNVRSPFFLVQQLLPVLGEGSNIIVISSLTSLHSAQQSY